MGDVFKEEETSGKKTSVEGRYVLVRLKIFDGLKKAFEA